MLDTEYKDESGKTIANTHDGRDQTVFVRDENVDTFRQYMQSHAEGGGDVNDPQYNDKLIRQYGFAAQFDQNIGIKGDAGMLEWAGTGGIVSGVKGLISAVKNARNLYKTYRAAKAAKASANLVKAAKANVSISGRLSFLRGKGGAYKSGQGKMGRHLKGHPDFIKGKSYFNSIDDAQNVLDAYHSGNTTVLQVVNENTVIVKYEGATGYFQNMPMIRAGKTAETTNIFQITGSNQAKIVPLNPISY